MVTKYVEDAATLIPLAPVESRVSGVIGGVKVPGCTDMLDIEGRIIGSKSALKPLKGIAQDHHLQLTSYLMITAAASGACRLDTVNEREGGRPDSKELFDQRERQTILHHDTFATIPRRSIQGSRIRSASETAHDVRFHVLVYNLQ